MRRFIIITIILLIATALITVVYFKNLNTPGLHTSQTMRAIPGNAALVFEFNNDDGFYDIFKGNKLLPHLLANSNLLIWKHFRKQLLANSLITKFFTGQNAFISLHPLKDHSIGLLFTIAAAKGFSLTHIDQLANK